MAGSLMVALTGACCVGGWRFAPPAAKPFRAEAVAWRTGKDLTNEQILT
jgi:hypothetical protein